ncbi:MAG: DNA polymerase domain-containing protein [Spirochaetota bacterium]
MSSWKGFIVASWARSGRIYATGRLETGESFALACRSDGGAVLVPAEYAGTAKDILARFRARPDPEPWTDLSGKALARFRLPGWARPEIEEALLAGGVPLPRLDRSGVDEYLADRRIVSGLEIKGEARKGERVDCVFVDPEIGPVECMPALRWLALDIETDRQDHVLAVSLIDREFGRSELRPGEGAGEVLFLGPDLGLPWITAFASEAGLLSALSAKIASRDPDVLTGWNVIDFDLAVLSARYAALGLPFTIGRSRDPAGFIERPGRRQVFDLPGRSVLDGIRLMRSAGERYEDQSLETVAQGVLGEGKLVSSTGTDKLAELERLRAEEPVLFCQYCLRDSELVLRILEKTGIAELTARRAALTGLSLDLAWTSIPAFERVYDAALRARHVIPPARDNRSVSGAAGGTVLDPRAGIFESVIVLDFRSLYPSLMRTFNIDPLAHARSGGSEASGTRGARKLDKGFADGHNSDDTLMAPNGARFSREPGILPEVITRYFAERERALAAGDATGAFVYKILMNSFYGVLGSDGCRYARTELAGAITSFARKYLTFARDLCEAQGYRVLYGDTDSVFVEAGRPFAGDWEGLSQLGETLAAAINSAIAASIREEYSLESFLRIRSDKVYGRFFIPRIRTEGAGVGGAILRREATGEGAESDEAEGRGRAKGYAGLERGGGAAAEVEVKGMEAARSDGTPLGRRFQRELLDLVFGTASGGLEPAGKEQLEAYCRSVASSLRSGSFDGELVYKRWLRRPASEYGSENPAVRAARILGWTDRRGRISWLMTTAGAEPPERRSTAVLDYNHYVEHQLMPIARSILDERGLDARPWLADRPQLELDW